jgi:predicted aspartyl protease
MVPLFRTLLPFLVLALAPMVEIHATASFVPFSFDSTGGIVVVVWINGRGPYKMLVDTGSSRSALSRRAATEAGAPVVARTSVVSIGQEASRLVVRLDEVEAGSAVRPTILASVIPDEELKAVASADGILGQDFLATLDYSIDYRKRTLAWETETAAIAPGEHRFALRAEEGRFLAEIPGTEQGQRALRLVPDSGASVLVLYERAGRLPVTVGRARRPLDIAGLSGARHASLSSVTHLRVGPVLLRDAPVIVLSECDDVPGADGLLPLSLFDRVTFVPSKGLLILRKD